MSLVVMFTVIFLIFVSFIAMTPLLYPMVVDNKIYLNCSTDYVIECLMLDLSMPIIVIVLLSLLVGFAARRIHR